MDQDGNQYVQDQSTGTIYRMSVKLRGRDRRLARRIARLRAKEILER